MGTMAGVWVFKDGVTRLVENPLVESVERNMVGVRRKVLVHLPSNQSITSYEQLEEKLGERGWEPYLDGDRSLRQYHKSQHTNELISLPKSFSSFKTMHMYDIVVKVPNTFQVRDG